MNTERSHDIRPARPKGISFAVLAAVLFGLSTPFAKLLLGHATPVMVAGLLYLGSGLGLSTLYFIRRAKDESPLPRKDWSWLAGAVAFGGICAPVLLMVGLRLTAASTASLLLNMEGVFTALLAWFVFKENFDKRIALGMALIVAGGVVLSWHGGAGFRVPLGALAIVGACLCWGIDNNLTQKVSASNPYQTAAIKGAIAGTVNLAIALSMGAKLPPLVVIGAALLIGFVGYGLSLALFVLALRTIGTARTGAYFAIAPFVGALIALVLLHEPVGALFFVAAALMGGGVWLHLTEKHRHEHTHVRLEHSHSHVHDAHHLHEHSPKTDLTEPHTHNHIHEPLIHVHTHFPDIHHRHEHQS